MADDDGRPPMRKVLDALRGLPADGGGERVTFDEVLDAVTPRLAPGATRADLFAALKNAQVTGGHGPGPAPDVSMGGNPLAGAFAQALAAQGPRCPGCGATEGVPHHQYCAYRGENDAYVPLPPDQPGTVVLAQFKAAQDPETPEFALPPDPISVGHEAGVAIAQMLDDMEAGGVPRESAERIIGTMLAVHGRMQKESDGTQDER